MALIQNFSSFRNIILSNAFKKHFHSSSGLLFKGGAKIKKKIFYPIQKEKSKKRKKISIIGAAGNVGSVLAYTLFIQNNCSEIIMYDIQKVKKRLCGHTIDIAHAQNALESPYVRMCTDLSPTADSTVVVICSSARGNDECSTPIEICQKNICIYKEMIPKIAKLSPGCVMVVMTSPTDIMAYAAYKYSCFEKNRIIGTGTIIDTARFRYHIAKRLGIHPKSVKGWIVGESGASSVPLWSSVNIAGSRIKDIDSKIGTEDDDNNWNVLHQKTLQDDSMLTEMKCYTNYGIVQCTAHLINSILNDSRNVLPVSTFADEMYGIKCCSFMSLPCVIGNRGVSHIVQQCLEEEEIELLERSACCLNEQFKQLEFP